VSDEFTLAIFSLCLSVGIPSAIFLTRNYLLAWISRSVQYRFDLKIEGIRAEIRQSEERLKSDLRDKEAEISALRNAVLSGSANRQTLLDKRRFEAVERVWTAVNDMAQLKAVANMMSALNFKALAKRTTDPKIQQFLGIIDTAAPQAAQFKNVARDERPFLPEIAWAYFSAYTTILLGSYMRLQILKTGIEDPERMLTNEATAKILKAALPHHSTFIDENEPEVYYYLLDEVENSLLSELKKILDGKNADQETLAKARQIMAEVEKAKVEPSPAQMPS